MDFQIVLPGKTIAGKGALSRAGLEKYGKKPLIVTGKHTAKSQAAAELLKYAPGGVVFDGITGEPTVEMINAGVAAYHENSCDHVIGIGGGSALDSAKAIAAMSVLGGNIADYMGKEIDGEFPPMVLIPTTAGTGSEATKFTIITDTEKDIKMLLKGDKLLPDLAVLDYSYTLSAPKSVTAATGMDALTHAVEAYLSLYYNTRETRALAESAVRDIFRYLPVACRDGQSLTARERMLRASFDAGCAFTRASVGNVHAIAHTLGGLYGIPHGLACAVTLPVVLEDYGAAVHPRLARLGSLIGLTGAERERAVGFLTAIRALNASLGIPDRFDGIRGEDLPRMAAWAAAEANPVYPVPVVYDQARFRRVLERLRA